MELKGRAVCRKAQGGGYVEVIAWLEDLARLEPYREIIPKSFGFLAFPE